MKRTSTPRGADATSTLWSFYIFGAGGTPAPQSEATTASIVVQASSLQLEILHLSPVFQGGRRVFCGRGSSLVRTTPPVVPLAKGDRTLAFGQSGAGF